MTASLCKSKQPEYRNAYERALRVSNPLFAERQRKNSRTWAKRFPAKKSQIDWEYHIKQAYGITAERWATVSEESATS